MSLAGVDLSNWQGEPGAWHGAAGDIGWAAVKITELMVDGSRYVNPDAASDWQALRASGKGRIAYLFGHPGANATDTAVFFLSELDRLGLAPQDAVAVDLETTDGRNPAQVSVWARMLGRILAGALRRPPLLYTYLDFAAAGNCSGLGSWPLWISDPSSPAGQPRIPRPWSTFAIHQYSIMPPVDRDVAAFPSLAAMAAALGRREPPPVTRSEEVMPQLLTKGAGAVTPVALPDGAVSVRVFPAGNAQLHYQFDGEIMQSLILARETGARSLAVPPGKHGVEFTRADAGAADVSYAVSIAAAA